MPSKVYKIKWEKFQNNPSSITSALDKFKKNIKGKTAIKTHFGEPGNKNAFRGKDLKPIADWAHDNNIEGFLTDSNTLYVGKRDNAIEHLQTARKHGFGFSNLGFPVIIADGLDGAAEEVFKLEELNNKYRNLEIRMGEAVMNADSLICISHVKGHPLFGFGGAIKNVGMGIASRAGKKILHTTTRGKVNKEKCTVCGTCIKYCPVDAISIENNEIVVDYDKCIGCGECVSVCPNDAVEVNEEDTKVCQEKTAVYTLGVVKDKPELYVNYVFNVNKVCDCADTTKPKLIDDLGILISDDPVAIDKASIDWVNEEAGKDLFR
ncbi:MAG: DUF362 domain-containing protein, partial [Minisyncoccales bacterium]